MPTFSGVPTWIGAPCASGKRTVSSVGRATSTAPSGRIETTSGPASAGALTGDAPAAHRDVRPGRQVLERNAGRGQRILEGERTTQYEADEIVAPDVRDSGDLLRQLVVAPHAVAWEI